MALSKEQHGSSDKQALLDAQLQLWQHTLGYVKSMALKAALDLRIPDAIDQHGGSATLLQIVTKVTLHPSKIPCLRRLMRLLTITDVFSIQHPTDAGSELVYGLTPASRLLVGSTLNLSPLLNLMLGTIYVSSFFDLGRWFQHEMPDPTLFKMAHGQEIWDLTDHDASFSKLFDNAMAADSSFIMDIMVSKCSDIFQGISSLVDVAGGIGGATQAIIKAFPHVECCVLDLSHVVASAPIGTKVKYIAGDMFESIPSANAVFLKWVLHDWDDADCIKILRNCKKAIPSKEQGGKVIILDIVVGAGSSEQKNVETQVLFDLMIMFINGIQRDEQQWKKIIFEAEFSDYKVIPVLGVRSVIEVYP
ncbi:unnamed protein product [Urochloa decumbens]|uniref:O-methyltransferase ZRP4 n=1 Tax=Urochloa decumbens TaxID=240449 RepID=A0ABC9B9X0_9POAL